MFTSRLFASLRNTALGLLVGASALGTAQGAGIVNVSASQNSVVLGGSFSLYFDISGLSPDSLGAFDLDLNFDNSVLDLTGFSFDDPTTGQNQLDFVGGLGFFGDAVDLGGVVDAFGSSGNSPATLDAEQAENFRFLTLTFTTLALSSGTSLGVDLNDPTLTFVDAGNNFLNYSFGSAGATVAVTSPNGGGTVPEPGALALVLTAFAGAALARPRRRNGEVNRPAFVPAH
jgi:hypothetical protein